MAAAAQPAARRTGTRWQMPAIICDDYPLRKAAERVLFVKYFNRTDLHHH